MPKNALKSAYYRLLRSAYFGLPADLQRYIAIKRRQRSWIDAGVVFIHVPKAAGTSISEALYDQFMEHVRAWDIERWGSEGLKALPRFAITRDPWDRLVSAYRFANRLLRYDWQTGVHVPRSVRSQIPITESFESFVLDWLRHRDPCKLNYIFQPQSLYVCDPQGKIIVEHLGRFEDLEPTFQFLRKYLKKIPTLSHSNRSGEPIDYREYYTPELVEIVAQIYADDVRNFGYSFDNQRHASASRDEGVEQR